MQYQIKIDQGDKKPIYTLIIDTINRDKAIEFAGKLAERMKLSFLDIISVEPV